MVMAMLTLRCSLSKLMEGINLNFYLDGTSQSADQFSGCMSNTA